MTGDLSRLSAALEELVRKPAPPMGLDVARAREVGRRTLTRKRTFNWLGGVVALALVAGVITAAVPRRSDSTAIPPPAPAHPLIPTPRSGGCPTGSRE